MASNKVHRITGGPMLLRHLESQIPAKYTVAQNGVDLAPGLIGKGPFAENEVTICPLPGDGVGWFKKLVEDLGGSWREFNAD